MRRIPLALVVVVLLGAGCGKSNPTKSSTDAISPTSSTETSSGTSGGPVPAVDNATDLKQAPVPHAGTPPAPTTLQKSDLVVGTGTEAQASNTVKVQYVGANFADGKVFDSSWGRGGQPATFPLSGVIPGFAQGIVGMKVGGRRELVIPPELGYGAGGSPPAVGPNETLIFIVDLVAIA